MDPEHQETASETAEQDKVVLSSTLKLPLNTASVLCYASGFFPFLGWLTGFVMLMLERDPKVRFHAYQAIGLFGALAVSQIVLGQSVIFSHLVSLFYLVQFVMWLLLIYNTYEGKRWALPYIGDWAARQVK